MSVSVDGVATLGFGVEPGGFVVLDIAPAAGKVVRASFAFDVPVRFASDRLEVACATWMAGEAASAGPPVSWACVLTKPTDGGVGRRLG